MQLTFVCTDNYINHPLHYHHPHYPTPAQRQPELLSAISDLSFLTPAEQLVAGLVWRLQYRRKSRRGIPPVGSGRCGWRRRRSCLFIRRGILVIILRCKLNLRISLFLLPENPIIDFPLLELVDLLLVFAEINRLPILFHGFLVIRVEHRAFQ